MEDTNPELEHFRQQWRAEVSARTTQGDSTRDTKTKLPRKFPPSTGLSTRRVSKPSKDEEEEVPQQNFGTADGAAHNGQEETGYGENSDAVAKEPVSALEHYEKAVDKETQGSLGDSLGLYRKAFRMDNRVDLKYKNKHFPPSYFASKGTAQKPATKPADSHAAEAGPVNPPLSGLPPTMKQLISSFSGFTIEPTPAEIEGTPAPPCPIAELPDEIIMNILTELAILDAASFVRLAQVCRRFAFLVATEEPIWKRICLGSEVGFGGMHYSWQREVMGGPIIEDDDDCLDPDEEVTVPPLPKEEITNTLFRSAYSSSWHQMFRTRPRIRFNGCYISTVNYMRPGQASISSVTWHSPVHIVTYFRYLRFFRDGTVISLLTTTEPTDVVHHLTKELQETHRGGAAAYLPSIVMQHAQRGRWRLSTTSDSPDADLKDAEGDVFVETEGASAKYMYRMKLSLRTVGKRAKNNKLAWDGYWNYNLLTDDAGEFTLKNEKPFFWSRVRSYGDGA